MKRIMTLLLVVLLGSFSLAQTVRIFAAGTQGEAIEPLLADFTAATGIQVEIEVGGATSEQRAQYLSTVLTAGSSDIDLYAFDVVDPLRFAASGWVQPLNDFFANEDEMLDFLSVFLQGEVDANLIDGVLYGIPWYTDAQFLYYRQDLLDKYGFSPPTTWEELKEQALVIMAGEADPNLQGFNYQGAAIEGVVCTFLEALWTAGGNWVDAEGNVTVNTPEALRALQWYDDTIASGITIEAIAEMTTDLSRQQFQSGNVVFMLNWGYAWARFQNDDDSEVAAKVGVAPLPAFEGNESATCVGGFQFAMNPHSNNKEAAFELMKYLTSYDSQQAFAINSSYIPSRDALYADSAVLEAAPHYGLFYDVIVNARPRPQTPYYGEVSQLIRASMNAFFARAATAEQTLEEMQFGLEEILAD